MARTADSAEGGRAIAATADRTTEGMALMAASMLVAPIIDVFAKLATGEATPAQIGLARFVVQTALTAPLLVWAARARRPPAGDLLIHAARGALIAVATALFFLALTEMAVADAVAIFFVEPLILTMLSALVLRERVGWRRWTACAVGFGGALLIIQPRVAELGWIAAAPAGGASFFALYLILTRRIAPRADAITVQFWAGLFGAATLGAAILAGTAAGVEALRLAPLSTPTLGMLFGVGACATVAHLGVVAAFARARASVLAPFQYLEIISATAFGWLIWGDFPDALTWLGVAIVVGAGLFVFHRERLAARRA